MKRSLLIICIILIASSAFAVWDIDYQADHFGNPVDYYCFELSIGEFKSDSIPVTDGNEKCIIKTNIIALYSMPPDPDENYIWIWFDIWDCEGYHDYDYYAPKSASDPRGVYIKGINDTTPWGSYSWSIKSGTLQDTQCSGTSSSEEDTGNSKEFIKVLLLNGDIDACIYCDDRDYVFTLSSKGLEEIILSYCGEEWLNYLKN